METNNENKNILSEPELRFREELKNCVKRIVDAADAKRGRWIVLDFAGILVHIFHPEEREYYNVERLWMDATTEIIRPEK